jgi:hypothetical protein
MFALQHSMVEIKTCRNLTKDIHISQALHSRADTNHPERIRGYLMQSRIGIIHVRELAKARRAASILHANAPFHFRIKKCHNLPISLSSF